VLGGLDCLVFTGGIGENAYYVREMCVDTLGFLGIEIDLARNRQPIQKDTEINTTQSSVKVFVIPTNEELVIADDTRRIVQEKATQPTPESSLAESRGAGGSS